MGYDELPLLRPEFPTGNFTTARVDKLGRRLPQTIAHRGYKANHPENTMAAFAGAVKAGAHAVETDIHLSQDGVVVLSHDATLKRCFGEDKKIIDLDWQYLSKLRTLKEPHEPMPRLKDLLEYLTLPGLEDIWVLLDIKVDNNPDDVMQLISKTIQSVSSTSKSWTGRIVLGIWTTRYLPLCEEYLPGFPVMHIGFSTCYAREFLPVNNVSFNMLQKILVGPVGHKFISEVKAAQRSLLVWTVNDAAMMRWSIRKKVDGVVTDDPKKFLEICDDFNEGSKPDGLSFRACMGILGINILAAVFSVIFRWRYGVRTHEDRWLRRWIRKE
jgi:glycerophosphoryl diester phosphodiesterase